MVLMGKPAAEALHYLPQPGQTQALGGKKSNALFLNRYGQRLTERGVQRILEEYATERA